MRIGIIHGYVMAIVGHALIVAGAWDIYLLYTEQTFEITLSDYATPTRTIAGGIAMIGLAQALRLLVAINRRLMGRSGRASRLMTHVSGGRRPIRLPGSN